MNQPHAAAPWDPYVWTDPERMGGEPCFRGTSLPVRVLFEQLAGDCTLERFIKKFDAPRDMVEGVLRLGPAEIQRSLSRAGWVRAKE